MSQRITGSIFCAIAAFLFAVRYLAAAMLYAQSSSFSSTDFDQYTEYTSPVPWILAVVALGIGIAYLVRGERADRNR